MAVLVAKREGPLTLATGVKGSNPTPAMQWLVVAENGDAIKLVQTVSSFGIVQIALASYRHSICIDWLADVEATLSPSRRSLIEHTQMEIGAVYEFADRSANQSSGLADPYVLAKAATLKSSGN